MENKNLTTLFNMEESPPPEDSIELSNVLNESSINPEEITQGSLSVMEKIDSSLPRVKGLEASDSEMDELASLATSSYKDLIDLGMNVESRLSGEIFSVASQFLGHAITAKTAKVNKKLKMLDLQLKKAKLDMDNGDSVESSTGQLLDRNELLSEILKQNNKDK